MHWKKKLLKNTRLYLILDAQVNSYEQLFEIAKQSIKSGVDIVQLRDKFGTVKDGLNFSKRMTEITQGRVPFIINDRVDLTFECGANGVHLGQDDISIASARKMLGPQAIIGSSCQTFEQAQKAQKDGADYIGFGSVFKTLTKPQRSPMDLNLLKRVAGEIQIPVFAIGGITLENIAEIQVLGINRFAVCRAICQARNVEETTQAFKDKVDCEGHLAPLFNS